MADQRRRPLTEEERRRADEAVAKLKRDLAEAAKRPRPPVTSPGKFSGWIGLDDQGNYSPPLTSEQMAHKETVHRRAREEAAPSPDRQPAQASIIDRAGESGADRATVARLAELLPDRVLRSSDRAGAEYVDELGSTYHVLGATTQTEPELWDANVFTTALGHLLRKDPSSFVVVDLTEAGPERAAAVRSYVDALAPEQRARVIALGF